MKISIDQFILRLIKFYAVALFIIGIVITLTPLITYIYTQSNKDLLEAIQQFPNSVLILSMVIFAICGGYCILVAIGYWRQQVWGMVSGIFILAASILLATSEQTEWAPKGVIQAIGGLMGVFHLLPIFVWKHFYKIDKIEEKIS